MRFHQTPYTTPERGLRSYKTGVFAAIITRSTPDGPRSFYTGGLKSIEAAREALAALEAAHPKRRPGRPPGPQGGRANAA